MRYKYTVLLAVVTAILFCCAGANAQNAEQAKFPKKITGVITDSNGEPVKGATILIRGTVNGVIADENGRYSIDAAEGDILEIRFSGYNPIEREVSTGSVINATMVGESILMDDIVVVGFGRQKKESVVSSISTVGQEELSMPNRNLTNNLAGQLAGIIAIQRSGEPGNDTAEFWIRGQSSYAGGTSPLVLVDGVPRSMNDIDVDEIETFSVLKDAAATAVYGSEGANGVVLITSKRGRTQKLQTNFRAQYSVVSPTRLPELLPAYDYLSLYNEAQWNGAGNPEWNNFLRTYSDEVIAMHRSGADADLYPNVNWMDMLQSRTSSQRYTLSFRGGSEKVRYFTSGAYYTEDGIFNSNPIEKYNANIGLDRYNLRSNVDVDLTPTTRLSVDLSGQYVTRNNPGSSSDAIFSMITKFPTHYIPMMYSDGTASEHSEYDPGLRANPYNMLNHSGYTKQWSINAQSKVTLDQKLNFITPGLSWRGSVGFDATSWSRMKRDKTAESFYATGRDEDGVLIKQEERVGTALGDPAYDNSGGDKRIYLETSLNYDRVFAKKHTVTGTAVYVQKSTQNQNVSGLSLLPYRKQSVVARGTYGYDGRYMFEASFGATGSENFSKGHRWGIFPAVGAAWYVSHEKFMQPLERVISKLKFRASYGVTGNDVIEASARFPYRGSLTTNSSGYNFGLTPGTNGNASGAISNGVIENNFASPNLTWEMEKKLNVGIDLGLFNGNVDLTVDWFSNRRSDILIRRNTDASATGFRNNVFQNFGVTTNKGIDASLVLRQRVGRWNISARGNLTYAKNKRTEMDEIPQAYAYQAATGTSINQPFVYIAEGLYTPDDFYTVINVNGSSTYTLKPDRPNPGTQVAPGDIKYKDLNGDNLIDSKDQSYHNDLFPRAPELVYGFGVNVEWKGISLGVFFQGAGRTSVNLLASADNFMPFNRGIDGSSARIEALDRWTIADPYNQDVLYPRVHSTKFDHNVKESTWWYRNGNFLRLKNLELGYSFNKSLLKKIRMESLRVYLQGTNMAIWDHVKLWDPELGNSTSGSKYPIGKTWTAGVEIAF